MINLNDTSDSIDKARIYSHQLHEDITIAIWNDYNIENIYKGLNLIDKQFV